MRRSTGCRPPGSCPARARRPPGRATPPPRPARHARPRRWRPRPELLHPSVPEVPLPCEDDGDAVLVGGGDHLFVAQGAARLDDRTHARLGQLVDVVAEREEGIAGARTTASAGVGLAGGDAYRVDAVLLTGADADRLAVLDEDDGVGLDPPADPPGQFEVAPL